MEGRGLSPGDLMLAIDRTDQRPAALERVRDLANQLARSNPNAKELIRELFLAFKSVYEEVWHPIEVESMRNAYAALAMIREAVEEVAPGALPSSDTVAKLYGPDPVHEAEAIADTLRELFADEDRERILTLPDWSEFKPRKPLSSEARSA
jgi:hypothetical protein